MVRKGVEMFYYIDYTRIIRDQKFVFGLIDYKVRH